MWNFKDYVMKIAVPTREGRVDNHFGHCDHYTIFTIEERKVISREELPSPQGITAREGLQAERNSLLVEVSEP